jgi:hypothetical protein
VVPLVYIWYSTWPSPTTRSTVVEGATASHSSHDVHPGASPPIVTNRSTVASASRIPSAAGTYSAPAISRRTRASSTIHAHSAGASR